MGVEQQTTVVQTLVDRRNGVARVMSIFTMAFTGTMPFGNLLVGLAWPGRVGGAGRTLDRERARFCLVTSRRNSTALLPGLRAPRPRPELARAWRRRSWIDDVSCELDRTTTGTRDQIIRQAEPTLHWGQGNTPLEEAAPRRCFSPTMVEPPKAGGVPAREVQQSKKAL